MSQAHGNGGGGCEVCGSLTFSQEWFDSFGVVLCNSCRQNEELITKSSAQIDYLLTEGDLKKLGSISRANPHKKDWSAMRLYLLSQCEKLAMKKYGDLDGIEAHRRNLLGIRQERRAQKRLVDQRREERETAILEKVKKKLEEAVKPTERRRKGEVVDAVTGTTQREYDDGVKAEVEDI